MIPVMHINRARAMNMDNSDIGLVWYIARRMAKRGITECQIPDAELVAAGGRISSLGSTRLARFYFAPGDGSAVLILGTIRHNDRTCKTAFSCPMLEKYGAQMILDIKDAPYDRIMAMCEGGLRHIPRPACTEET